MENRAQAEQTGEKVMSIVEHTENEASFLGTIRKAVAPDSDAPRLKADFPDLFDTKDARHIEQRIQSREDIDIQGLVASFKENAAALNLSVYIVESSNEAADVIEDIVRVSQPEFGTTRQIMQHAHPDIAELRLWERFSDVPVALHTTYLEDPQRRDKTLSSYIGITVADWGISESATLLQITRADRPRSTSLVPSIHIGLLRKSKLLSSLTEAYTKLKRDTIPNSFTFISGPSKTADIEAHMVHGAHGPKEMHVIIMD